MKRGNKGNSAESNEERLRDKKNYSIVTERES